MFIALLYRCKFSVAALGILLAVALLVPPWTMTMGRNYSVDPPIVALGYRPVFRPPPLSQYATGVQVDGTRLALTLAAVVVVCSAAAAIEYAIAAMRATRGGGFPIAVPCAQGTQ